MLTDQQLQTQINQQFQQLQKIRNYSGKDEIVPLASLSFDQKYSVQLKSGLPTLDFLLNGFTGGELIVISGPTKNGKSSLAATLTSNFAEKQINSLWFSFEMPYRQLVNFFGIKVPELVFVPAQLTNSTLLWIKSKILEAILKFDIKAVFIDHLGFVRDLVQKQDRRIEIDTIVREIKTMAIELDIVIFVLHHIRKTDVGAIPTLEDLKESSGLAQDSDKVLMIWRDFKRVRGGEI